MGDNLLGIRIVTRPEPISPDMGSTLHNSSCSNGNFAIPGHQQHFFEESCKDLTEDQADNVAQLLIKYEDVF